MGYVSAVYPQLGNQERQVDVKYINDCLGLGLKASVIADLLSRMALEASPSADGKTVSVLVPPTRSDVLHAADIMEVRCQTFSMAAADQDVIFGCNFLIPLGMLLGKDVKLS